MLVLGLDTCLTACSAAILDGSRVLAWRSEPMARGHQERLAPMVKELARETGLEFRRLDRIGVTVGPGSFTGLRVGIAFAKGMASALGIPAIGVGALEALAGDAPGRRAAVIDARRDQVYLQLFDGETSASPPEALGLDAARARIERFQPIQIIGSGAYLLADAVAGVESSELDGCDPRRVAWLAARASPAPLTPLYLRAPDARLPA